MEPIYTIPPDLVEQKDYIAFAPKLWHIPLEEFEKVWSEWDGSGEIISINDTGVSPHPDLPEPVYAESFVGEDPRKDGNSHGTHCAGIALGRNGLGVAPGADLMVLQVLSSKGSGGGDGIAKAKTVALQKGATVTSESLGGPQKYQPDSDAYDALLAKGACSCVAAGNSGFSGSGNTIDWPGGWPQPFTIGALTEDWKTIAKFSSGGPRLDIVAPGQNIISASNKGGGYSTKSGTSMATPYAAGLMALLRHCFRSLGIPIPRSQQEWDSHIKGFAKDLGVTGPDPTYGQGVILVWDVLEALATRRKWV